jgi:hypothetical protein
VKISAVVKKPKCEKADRMTDETSPHRLQIFSALPLGMKKVATKTAAQTIK